MNCRTKWVVFAFVAFQYCGCGTVNNLSETHVSKVYGGVRHDLDTLKSMEWKGELVYVYLFFLPFYIIDLPLSAIGDTVTLPQTIDAERTRSQQKLLLSESVLTPSVLSAASP